LFYNEHSGKIGGHLHDVYDGNALSEKGLAWFLELGFVPGELTLFDGIKCLPSGAEVEWDGKIANVKNYYRYEDLIRPEQHEGKSHKDLFDEGLALCRSTVHKLYTSSNKKPVLPITSGLDSRLLLGALMECTTADKIETYTWGLPNTYDLDVGAQLAKHYGIKHREFDVTKYELTEKRLLDYAKLTDCNASLFKTWPVEDILSLYGEDEHSIWMGLLGGSASGANLLWSQLENPYQAFFPQNTSGQRFSSFAAIFMDMRPEMSDVKYLARDFNSVSHDVLDLYFHHGGYIAHCKILRGLDITIPFADPDLLSFFLSLPIEQRLRRILLWEIIVKGFPHLADYPSNRTYGAPLSQVKSKSSKISRVINRIKGKAANQQKRRKFMDLQNMIRKDDFYHNLFKSKLQNLADRKILKNSHLIDQLWREHLGTLGPLKHNHETGLNTLASLEIILESIGFIGNKVVED